MVWYRGNLLAWRIKYSDRTTLKNHTHHVHFWHFTSTLLPASRTNIHRTVATVTVYATVSRCHQSRILPPLPLPHRSKMCSFFSLVYLSHAGFSTFLRIQLHFSLLFMCMYSTPIVPQ